MFARDRKTPIAEWWWTIDKQLLAALTLLLVVGIVLSFAASMFCFTSQAREQAPVEVSA